MVNLVLIHVIIVIYHTTPFTWAIILTHVNRYHFPIILIVTKMVIVSNLCLTHVILFILIYVLGPFSSQTTFNDSYLVQFYIIFDQNDGRVVNSPLSNIIKLFQGYSQWEDGVVLRRTGICRRWSSTAGHLVVHPCPKLTHHLSFQALFHFF